MARLDCAGRAFAAHFHDEYVLSVNVRGAERILLDGKNLEARERDITLYNPSQVQSSHALGQEWQFLSLYVDPALMVDVFDISQDTVFERPVLTHDEAASRMASAIQFAIKPLATNEEASERLIQTLDELLGLVGSRPLGSREFQPSLGAWPNAFAKKCRRPHSRCLPKRQDCLGFSWCVLSPVHMVYLPSPGPQTKRSMKHGFDF